MNPTLRRTCTFLVPALAIATLTAGDWWATGVAHGPWVHVLLAGAAAALAVAASIVALRASADTRSVRVTAAACGCAALGAGLGVHALATPGAVFGENLLVGVTSLASVVMFAGGCAVALLAPAHWTVRASGALVALTAFGVVAASVGAQLVPGLLEMLPRTVTPPTLLMFIPSAAAIAAFALLATRVFGPRSSGGSFTLEAGCAFLGGSLLMHYGPAWSWSFWLSHGFETVGAVLLLAGIRSISRVRITAQLAPVGTEAEVIPLRAAAQAPAARAA